MRFCFATSENNIIEGMNRMKNYLEKLPSF